MKLKLDENLGARCIEILVSAGHDVATVHAQSLAGATDREVIEACRAEGRALVTLDLDFSNPLLFQPSQYAGIVVLRLPKHPTHGDLVVCVKTLLEALTREAVTGNLWSVERGRVRIYQPPESSA